MVWHYFQVRGSALPAYIVELVLHNPKASVTCVGKLAVSCVQEMKTKFLTLR